MSKLVISAAMGLSLAAASAAHAKTTIAVGTCQPGNVSFTTIGAAISHAPANAIIDICPGTYPEQLVITKNLTLQGVTSNNGALADITFPSAGAVVNAADLDGGEPTAAQILVQGPAAVTIENLNIDGSANNDQSCGEDIVGILYQNASGTIHSNNVVNQTQPAGYTGCQNGLAIYVETTAGSTSNVTISGNNVATYQKNGITVDDAGSNATITGNTVIGVGPTTGAASNGIQIAYGATASIGNNHVGNNIWAPDTSSDTGDAASGILIYASAGVTVSGNTVDSNQYGIVVVGDGNGDADGTKLNGNFVLNTLIFDAVDICGAGNATINNTTVSGATESAVHLDSSCGSASTGNTVSMLHVNGACAAILEGAGSAGTMSGLTATNAGALVQTGSDQCPVVTTVSAAQPRATKHRHAVPFR